MSDTNTINRRELARKLIEINKLLNSAHELLTFQEMANSLGYKSKGFLAKLAQELEAEKGVK